MKKQVLSLALAAAMAASLTACSGNSSTTETTAAAGETKAAENAATESKEALTLPAWIYPAGSLLPLYVSFLTMRAAALIQSCVR